jgi:hypothetical protein
VAIRELHGVGADRGHRLVAAGHRGAEGASLEEVMTRWPRMWQNRASSYGSRI